MPASGEQAKDFGIRMSKILRAGTSDAPLPEDAVKLVRDLRAAGEKVAADNLQKAIDNW